MTDTVREAFEKQFCCSYTPARVNIGLYAGDYQREGLQRQWVAYKAGRESMREEVWQPIETAPMHKPILLWWKTCPYPLRGFYDFDEDYLCRKTSWKSPESGWRNDGDQCIPVNQEDCTYWMPLPAAPDAIKELP